MWMNYKLLNDMIKYIEDNITENISYNKLAKIVGVSEYSLQRIFVFLTNMSISEYIRKRRLSKAFEELKISNVKIVELSVKYGYDSQISFARAFKSMFGISPSEVKNNEIDYKQFPIIKFNNNNDICQELNYKIEQVEETKIYCVKTQTRNSDDLLYKIRKLYLEIKNNGLHKKFNDSGMYGISISKDNLYMYYIGSKEKYDNTIQFVIPKGRYVIFSVGSRQQQDIVKTENIIYNQWLNSTNYNIDSDFNFELYIDNNCYLYMKLKDKQK